MRASLRIRVPCRLWAGGGATGRVETRPYEPFECTSGVPIPPDTRRTRRASLEATANLTGLGDPSGLLVCQKR